MQQDAPLRVEREGAVLRITVDRPTRHNPLSRPVLARLRAALAENASDATLRCALITGAGNRYFAAGGDVHELDAVRTPAQAREMSDEGRATLDAVRDFPVPVLAVLNGDALGGGAELAVPPLTLATAWPPALLATALLALACAALAQPLRTALDSDRSPGGTWPGPAAFLRPVRMVWQARELRTLALCSFVFSAVQVCLTAYAVSWLTADLGWALVAAGVALAVSQTAGVAGRVLWGWIADRGPGARRMLIALSLVMMACALVAPWLGRHSPTPWVLAALALFGGTAIGWNGVYLAAVARLAPSGQAGTATGGTPPRGTPVCLTENTRPMRCGGVARARICELAGVIGP